MSIKKHIKISIGVILLIAHCTFLSAQQTVRIRGTVTDASTGEPLSYANVSLMPANLGIGTMTNDDGQYTLEYRAAGTGIQFSYIGYEPVTMDLTAPKNGILNVSLNPLATELEDVVVTARRTRYRNRGNPAVELIRKAIANKDKNRM